MLSKQEWQKLPLTFNHLCEKLVRSTIPSFRSDLAASIGSMISLLNFGIGLQSTGLQHSQAGLRRNSSCNGSEGAGEESSIARNRSCCSASSKKVHWSRMASSASRHAQSSMNSESFWPRKAAAWVRTAFRLADALIWMTSSLGANERRFEFGCNVRSILRAFP